MDDDGSSPSEPEVYRAPPRPVWHDEGDVISLVQVVNVLLRHRWKVVGPSIVGAALALVVALLLPPTYTSQSKLVPQTGGTTGQLGRLTGVAAQFGVDVMSADPGQSPEFYANLLMSRRLLHEAVTSRYVRSPAASEDDVIDSADGSGSVGEVAQNSSVPGDSSEALGKTLVELYDIEAPSRDLAVANATERLKEDVSASANTETGIVDLSVTTEWPAVSAQLAQRLIELVNVFNNRVRQSQASAQAAFVQERLQSARRELRTAEDSMENFLQRNARWEQSPSLRFEHQRLQRRVSLKQEVYTSLANRYEEARISEVKETPVVTVVTEPEVPVRHDSREPVVMAGIGLLVGGMLGLGWAFWIEMNRKIQEGRNEEYRELAALKEETAQDVRRFGLRIRRFLPGMRSRTDD